MKLIKTVILFALSFLEVSAFAKPLSKNADEAWLQQIKAAKISSWAENTHFRFDSTKGPLFNRYRGDIHAFGLGKDNVKIKAFSAGFYLKNNQSHLLTDLKLGPLLSRSTRTTLNRGLYLHAMKNVNKHVQVDIFGGYGYNLFRLQNTIDAEKTDALTGHARYHGEDALTGIRGLFSWHRHPFFLQTDVDYFYARFIQPDYQLIYPGNTVNVPKLITNVGTWLENAKLTFFAGDYWAPFVTGSLIQVASRSFNRPVIAPNVAAATLPDLFLAKNGYALGAGLMFKYKKAMATAGWRYENRKNQYISNALLLKLDWACE